MNPALATLLTRPDLWRGDALAAAPAPGLASGFAALDAELPGGGWPRGQATELLLAVEGGGEWALLAPALAGLAREGRRIALVLPPGEARRPHAPGWARLGVPLAQLLLVRAANAREGLWAALETLRCAGIGATLLWPDTLARPAEVPNALRRLHGAAGEGGGCAFLLRPAAMAAHSSPAPLRLLCAPALPGLRVELLKRRGRPAGAPLLLEVARPVSRRRLDHVLARLRPAADTRRPSLALA